MSFIERTAKKLFPILEEVKKKMVKERPKKESKGKGIETLDVDDEELDGSESQKSL